MEWCHLFWSNILTSAHKLACIHASFLHAPAHIFAKIGQIMWIEVSTESGEHANNFGAHIVTCVHKLVLMHTLFLHALAYIFTQYGKIRGIEVFTKSWPKQTSYCASALNSCMLGPYLY